MHNYNIFSWPFWVVHFWWSDPGKYHGLKILSRDICGSRPMGDIYSVYWNLLNSVSHLLLWSRGNPPVNCECGCGVTIAVDSCSQLVKDVITHCVETTVFTTQTTTTTTSSPQYWDLSWLWILLLVFCAGLVFGRVIPTIRVFRSQAQPQLAILPSNESSPSRAEP